MKIVFDSEKVLKYRPIPGTIASIEQILTAYLGKKAERFKVVLDHELHTATFKFPFPIGSEVVNALEAVRPAGTGFRFDRLKFYECIFKRKQWVDK